MERASEGFEHIAMGIIEMQQRTQALLTENRQLRAELAALQQGAGIMVVIEGRMYPLAAGSAPPNDPLYPLR
jgi:hypothetical protein